MFLDRILLFLRFDSRIKSRDSGVRPEVGSAGIDGKPEPQIPEKYEKAWLPIAMSSDPGDPRLAHLDGLNLSRAWMLEGIVSSLPTSDLRRAPLIATVEAHRRAGIATVTGEHYEGGHWLASFAVYLETQRGLISR